MQKVNGSDGGQSIRQRSVAEMSEGFYEVAGTMISKANYGVSRKPHDAESYHLQRQLSKSTCRLQKVVEKAVENMNLKVTYYYAVHLYANSCMLIVPQKFADELNKAAREMGSYSDIFGVESDLTLQYGFEGYWRYTKQELTDYTDMTKNSCFTIDAD